MPMDPEKDKSYVGDVDVMDNLENGDDRETHKIRSRSGKPLEKYLIFFFGLIVLRAVTLLFTLLFHDSTRNL